jgi:pimeloyl-ACP methyl ester carboxylesterase
LQLLAAMAVGAMLSQQAPQLSSLLDYDRNNSTGVILERSMVEGGAAVDDVRVIDARTTQEIAEAYIVRPEPRPAECAGVLFVHWFAPPDPSSNRTQFLDEAKAWARRGVVSVLPSTFWSDSARYRARTWQTDYANSVDQAIRLRRMLAVLRAQTCVDPSRLAIVGHDYGAMFGSMVAAVEPGVKAAVLIAGVPELSSWYGFGTSTGVPTGDDLVRFRAELARIAPARAVAMFTAPTLFQFGTKDRYTPKDQYEAFFAASASLAKEMKLYDSEHDMKLPQIREDRTAWLAQQLGVK